MAHLPIFEQLSINDYSLFPGTRDRPGLSHEFEPGLTLVLGANGLGKTTLVTLLFRLCSGPYDIPGMAKRGGVFGGKPIDSRLIGRQERRTFAARVSDGAPSATATLRFKVGPSEFLVTRSMADLSLVDLQRDNAPIDATERDYHDMVVRAADLPTFGDWIFLLRHLVFYFEDRRALVWDPSAQVQLLRLLQLSPESAREWERRDRAIRQLDSRARNLQAALPKEEQALADATASVEDADDVLAELTAAEEIQRQEQEEMDELDGALPEIENERQAARLEALKAEIALDAVTREYERLQLQVIESAFPSADQTASYILARLFTDSDCLACGNSVPKRADELRGRLAAAECVVCGTDVSRSTPGPSARSTSRKKRRRQKAEQALQAAELRRSESESSFDELLLRLQELRSSLAERQVRLDVLVTQLPPDEAELRQQHEELKSLRTLVETMKSQLKADREAFSHYFDGVNHDLARGKEDLKSAFNELAKDFLLEDCTLILGTHKARIGETGPLFDFPVFELEMGGAGFESPIRRAGPDQVSESQREFIDLAFRMAVTEALVAGGTGSLVIDAPESSLDAVFVSRAAEVLTKYAARQNRLVITSNLIEGDLIPQLAMRAGIRSTRSSRVIDLFSVAAPTAATHQHRTEYAEIRERLFERAALLSKSHD